MDQDKTAAATDRPLYRAWAPTDVPDTDERPPRQRRPRGSGPLLAAAPMLLAFALIIGAALIVGATARATTALSRSSNAPVAGAEQMRRQAQAAQAFQARQYADAYGRFAALADEGDAPSALLALAMVRHGPALFRSEWSATHGQLQRWSALALQDLREHGPLIAAHDRGE